MPDTDIQEAREEFDAAMDADRENRVLAEADLRFLSGDQWEADARQARIGRPMYTFNRLPQYERQITGDMRLNPPSIKVRPVGGGADKKTAATMTGLIRNIEAQSDGQAAYLTAATNAVRCGEGWFGITYDYVPDGFDMEFRFRRIPNPFAVVCDPGAVDPTRADATFAFVSELLPTATFNLRYPKASLTGWDDTSVDGWGSFREGEFVRVAERWRKVPCKRRLILTANQSVIDATDLDDASTAMAVQQAGGFLRERMADGHKVKMCVISGVEELEEDYDWPGQYIPLIRVAGDEINVGERTVRYGIVRFAREPQMLYNFQRTAMAESVAMAPKPKWLVTPAMIAGAEDYWKGANTNNIAFLPFQPDQAAPQGPQRIAPDMPAAALVQDAQAAAQDIEATIGIYRDNLGRESNAQSGRAILSRQREGDVGTFLYMDNLATSVTQAGRVLVDAMPKVLDTPRTERILGEDGKEDFAPINMPMQMPDGSIVKVNDLSVGRYDVVASVGPAYSTRAEEARESMMAFSQSSPQVMNVAGDLIAEAMGWPGAEGIAKRLRRIAVAQGVAEPQEGEAPPQQPPPGADVMLAQAEMQKAQAAMIRAQAEMAKVQLETEKARLQAQEAGLDFRLKSQEAQLEAQMAGVDFRLKAAAQADREEQTRIKGVTAAAGIADKIAGYAAKRIERQERAAAMPMMLPPGFRQGR